VQVLLAPTDVLPLKGEQGSTPPETSVPPKMDRHRKNTDSCKMQPARQAGNFQNRSAPLCCARKGTAGSTFHPCVEKLSKKA
jgi:hypothetical protein